MIASLEYTFCTTHFKHLFHFIIVSDNVLMFTRVWATSLVSVFPVYILLICVKMIFVDGYSFGFV